MPVDTTFRDDIPIYQREQYAKGGIGRLYWDYRDSVAFSYLKENIGSIADIGCGEGITLEKIARLLPAARCVGIDSMRENLSICGKLGLQVVGANVYDLPFSRETLDSVLLLEVIEHLTEPKRALSEIMRVLKPGGIMIMIFPHDVLFVIARIMTFKFREAFYDPGHVHRWNPRSMKKLLNACGFRIMQSRSIPFFLWCMSLHHVIFCRKES